MKSKLITLIAGGLMLSACSSNVWDYDGSSQVPEEEDYVNVTFSLKPETVAGLSRAEGDNPFEQGPGRWQTLSKGSKIDMLIYAVYDSEYTLMSQYSEGVDEKLKDKFTVNAENHAGQTIMYVGEKLYKGEEVLVELRLMRNRTYHIAFWAQSSETDAYDTNDLSKVEVKYENAANNDELRDAFCKVETFTVSTGGVSQDVILTRPLAQINVGTTGADYKNMEKGKFVANHKAVTYSKITIQGVAKYFDVVKDRVLGQADLTGDDKATTDVTFNWAKIPAYYNTEIPTENLYNKIEGEELLTIDLNQNGEILPYKTSYPTLGSKGGYMTEEFKYLSMAYVLVPTATADQEQQDGYSVVINKVVVEFANDAAGTTGFKSLEVLQIPSRRNWRTNIIGGLRWIKDPTDPDDPDNPTPDPDDPDNPKPTPPDGPSDPSTVFNTVNGKIFIAPGFINDLETIYVEKRENSAAQN